MGTSDTMLILIYVESLIPVFHMRMYEVLETVSWHGSAARLVGRHPAAETQPGYKRPPGRPPADTPSTCPHVILAASATV